MNRYNYNMNINNKKTSTKPINSLDKNSYLYFLRIKLLLMSKVFNKNSHWRATIGELPLESYHWRATIGELPLESYHWRATIGELPLESYHWRGTIGELPLERYHWRATIAHKLL